MFKLVESLSSTLSASFKQSMESFIDLETIQDARTLVTAEGSLVSIIKIDGFRGILGEEEISSLLETLTVGLSPFITRRGYAMQIFYNRELNIDDERLRKYQSTARMTAEKFGLSMEDLFDAELKTLSEHSVFDEFYLALWTQPSALSKEEISESKKNQFKEPWVLAPRSQEPRVCIKDLNFRHESYLMSVLSMMETGRLRAECLEVHEALKAIRSSLYPGRNYENWRANLPGDPLRPRFGAQKEGDYSDILWPSLRSQLCDENPEVISRNVIKIGDRLWGAVDLTLAPAQVQSLASLMRALAQSDVPFRISFFLDGDVAKAFSVKKMMGSFLYITVTFRQACVWIKSNMIFCTFFEYKPVLSLDAGE